jgi:phosphoribosylformylglycinamidine synthase
MKFKASVKVTLKTSVLDPQGAAIERALKSMGRQGVDSIRVGKIIEIVLEGSDLNSVQKKVESWADELLANPVMENYSVSLESLS